MGRYDDISDDRLKAQLTSFANLLLRMEEEGILLQRTGAVLRLLGELRRMLFAYEVRSTRRDQEPQPHPRAVERTDPDDDTPEDGGLGESIRIVREALEREREFLEGLDRDEEAP